MTPAKTREMTATVSSTALLRALETASAEGRLELVLAGLFSQNVVAGSVRVGGDEPAGRRYTWRVWQ